jgi:hypothetical protein
MRRILLATSLAVCAALAMPADAKAQFGPVYRPAPGWSVSVNYVSPGYGYGYRPYEYSGLYGPGISYFVDQSGHFHGYRYIPPHTDYYHRGYYHAVNPYTGRISPYPHQHRHPY